MSFVFILNAFLWCSFLVYKVMFQHGMCARPLSHFIMDWTGCQDKINLQKIHFGNYNLCPLNIYNGPPWLNCIKLYGTFHWSKKLKGKDIEAKDNAIYLSAAVKLGAYLSGEKMVNSIIIEASAMFLYTRSRVFFIKLLIIVNATLTICSFGTLVWLSC